jgi:flagellar biosynthesis repressor protein FlbT
MNITLRAGERLFINGAVIRLDRKASVELLNDVTFLLENHVMQAKDATTPLKQIYFAVQIVLMDPSAAAGPIGLANALIESAMTAFDGAEVRNGLKTVATSVARARYFEALKALRALFAQEEREMFPQCAAAEPSAA